MSTNSLVDLYKDIKYYKERYKKSLLRLNRLCEGKKIKSKYGKYRKATKNEIYVQYGRVDSNIVIHNGMIDKYYRLGGKRKLLKLRKLPHSVSHYYKKLGYK